jgi:hypothetical protein
MRYVIVDTEGSSRGYFGSLREVREWARVLKGTDADLLAELLLLTYDADGDQVASQWLSDFVPEVRAIISVALYGFETRSTLPTQITGAEAAEGWSGTATSTTPVFVHPRTPASDTGSPALAGTAAS